MIIFSSSWMLIGAPEIQHRLVMQIVVDILESPTTVGISAEVRGEARESTTASNRYKENESDSRGGENTLSGGVEAVRHAPVKLADGDSPLSGRGSCAPPAQTLQ